MDDLIVIILTLVIAVAGALGQIKKKKEETPAPAGNIETEDLWDVSEDEEITKERPLASTLNREEPVVAATKKTTAKPRSLIQEKGKYVIPDNVRPKEKFQRKQVAKKEKFPLRKAVIYSEILNRKYT